MKSHLFSTNQRSCDEWLGMGGRKFTMTYCLVYSRRINKTRPLHYWINSAGHRTSLTCHELQQAVTTTHKQQRFCSPKNNVFQQLSTWSNFVPTQAKIEREMGQVPLTTGIKSLDLCLMQISSTFLLLCIS